jgi:hypothetical protein
MRTIWSAVTPEEYQAFMLSSNVVKHQQLEMGGAFWSDFPKATHEFHS